MFTFFCDRGINDKGLPITAVCIIFCGRGIDDRGAAYYGNINALFIRVSMRGDAITAVFIFL